MPQRAKLSKWKADPEAAMQRLFDSLPNGPELGRAERVSPMMGVVEYPNLIPKTFTRGLALIGDEALSVDPLSGVGSAAGPSNPPNGWQRPSTGPGKLQALSIVALRLTAGGTDVNLLAMNFSSQISRPAAHTIRSSG